MCVCACMYYRHTPDLAYAHVPAGKHQQESKCIEGPKHDFRFFRSVLKRACTGLRSTCQGLP